MRGRHGGAHHRGKHDSLRRAPDQPRVGPERARAAHPRAVGTAGRPTRLHAAPRRATRHEPFAATFTDADDILPLPLRIAWRSARAVIRVFTLAALMLPKHATQRALTYEDCSHHHAGGTAQVVLAAGCAPTRHLDLKIRAPAACGSETAKLRHRCCSIVDPRRQQFLCRISASPPGLIRSTYVTTRRPFSATVVISGCFLLLYAVLALPATAYHQSYH